MTADVLVPRAGRTVLRPIEPADAPEAARIVFEAFAGIHDRHGFARDFPTLEAAEQLVEAFVAHPSIYGVVAEVDGRIAGSNFLDERGPVRGVGPITVDPAAQASGVGRRLMEDVLRRGEIARGVRLLQDAFNSASLSLYASLGFEVREPIALLSGEASLPGPAGIDVRPLRESDLEAAEALSVRVHGYERTAELRDALASPQLEPLVAVRDGRITGYAATLAVFPAAHAAAETQHDLRALIAAAGPVSFLLPTRQAEVLRWALSAGLRVLKPMTYMTTGEFREPDGAWVPSVLY
jgi:predicted N-acetyltransferase YhbS